MQESIMQQKRDTRRYSITEYSKNDKVCLEKFFGVYDRATDQHFGYLVNLSATGMMILSREEIKPEISFELKIHLPEDINGVDQLAVNAASIWCEKDINPDFYRVGFKFLTASPSISEIVEFLFAHKATSITVDKT
jgi:c-di-GMP-binding flagellar brake protein YcgR